MFEFSGHPELSLDKRLYSTGWISIAGSMDSLAIRMENNMTSPIVWKEGKRRAHLFDYADTIALDADDGRLTIKMAQEEFGPYEHVIATTKSHQRQKGNGGPCDRLRIYLRLDERISTVELFSYISFQLAKKYHCDLNPVDGARMYMPSWPISVATGGLRINVAYYAAMAMEEQQRREKEERAQLESKQQRREKFAGTRTLPNWCVELLMRGVPAGESRNKACFKLGIFATEAGFNIEEIVEMIMVSPIPVGIHVRLEVEQAVRSGAQKAIKFKE